jgi:hypothetical protein
MYDDTSLRGVLGMDEVFVMGMTKEATWVVPVCFLLAQFIDHKYLEEFSLISLILHLLA